MHLLKKVSLLKKDKNLISRDDPELEDAVELDGWGLAIFKNLREGLALTDIYLREGHSDDYRLKFIGNVCLSKLPEFLQKEVDPKQIKNYPDCCMGAKEPSCERCTYNQHRMFSESNYFK